MAGNNKHFFALVDCNNFFVSCERVFNPALWGRPVVVLSSNDGCIVSRSNEAKALGIPMGAPYFQIRDELARHHAAVLSSNFSLYGDMSRRVMGIIRSRCDRVAVYSIDEAFIELDEDQGVYARMRKLRSDIYQWTGIPVSVGVAPTKTLAKVAAERVKKDPVGVGAIFTEEDRQAALAELPAGEVWGIGRRFSVMLAKEKIFTAGAFAAQPREWIRERMGVHGLRLQSELSGLSCHPLHEDPPVRESITSSRSFGLRVTQKRHLEEAVAYHAARIGEKLRARGLAAQALSVSIRGSRYSSASFSGTEADILTVPTNDSMTLIHAAHRILDRIYREGGEYKKAGMTVWQTCPFAHGRQGSLFEPADPQRERLMAAVDSLNVRFGRSAVHLLAEGVRPLWKARQERMSPQYTTRFSELLEVKAQ